METPDAGRPEQAGPPDFYAALRVPPSASRKDIARAYRALMRNLHPDVDRGHPSGDEAHKAELLRIMQAFAVLREPRSRAAYDRRLTAGRPASGPDPGSKDIPVHHFPRAEQAPSPTIRITPVHWESGPWA